MMNILREEEKKTLKKKESSVQMNSFWQEASICLMLPLTLCVVLLTPCKSNADDTGWQFMAEAYFWYASIGGDSSDGGDIQIDTNDLVDDLNFGGMGAVGATRDKWSFLVDAIFLDVSDSTNSTFNGVRTQWAN